jgi:hypothetical protein
VDENRNSDTIKNLKAVLEREIADRQDLLRYLREKRQQRLLENQKDIRGWQIAIGTISFSIAGALAPIIFVSGQQVISLYILIGLGLLVFNGIYTFSAVKIFLEKESIVAPLFGSDQEIKLMNQQKAAWYLKHNLLDSELAANYASATKNAANIETTLSGGIDFTNDVSISILAIGIFSLIHDFVPTNFENVYFFIASLLILALLVTTRLSLAAISDAEQKKSRDNAELNKHAKEYSVEIGKIEKVLRENLKA